MKIIVAPDSFKGSLSAFEACDTIIEAISKSSNHDVFRFPMADGGEGTLDVLISALGGEYAKVDVKDPLGRTVQASFGICGKIAIIESARACGLTLLSDSEKNPLLTSTFGVGQLICAALDRDVDEIYLTLGGSSTNDCGIGMLSALGAKFYGNGLSETLCGNDLSKITAVDFDHMDERLKNVQITAICDVENPLYGENGAAYVFAPQKGADAADVKILDDGLRNFAATVNRSIGIDVSSEKGAGAAGGLGAALMLLNAKMKKGCDMILSLVGFDDALKNADYVFTGEGSFDDQSFMGKVVGSIYSRAQKANVPVAVFAGRVGDHPQKKGLNAVCITPKDQPVEIAMKNAHNNLYNAVLNYIEKNSAN